MKLAARNTISFKEALNLCFLYASNRISKQAPAVVAMIAYLMIFQTLVLGMPLSQNFSIVVSSLLLILGLAFFLEGLNLGLMPLGETIGLRLPRKRSLSTVLILALVIGIVATFAEPSIAALKLAGSTVAYERAPLLYRLLNQDAWILVFSIALGVGAAVVVALLRFYRSWKLRSILYLVMPILISLTIAAKLHPQVQHLIGLAWDSGGVTTGPVTVPLVLALGIGVSRMVGKEHNQGFGIVTLASLFPIGFVLVAGFVLSSIDPGHSKLGLVPALSEFFTTSSLESASRLSSDFGTTLEKTLSLLTTAIQAVLPLCLLLLFALKFLIREKIKRRDEVFFGIFIAIIGMFLLSIGIQFGLSSLGTQVGKSLPVTWQSVSIEENSIEVKNFDHTIVQHSIDSKGTIKSFFLLEKDLGPQRIWFDPASYNASNKSYTYVPQIGPLLAQPWSGLALALFVFFLGYGATRAEPALITMGKKIEDLTAGTLKSKLLERNVAVGVGLGLVLGLLQNLYQFDFVVTITLVYAGIMILGAFSHNDFVDIAWDCAGVTTGPITVPLVIALGLGLGTQNDIVEGFGMLSLASSMPILLVLVQGLIARSLVRNKL